MTRSRDVAVLLALASLLFIPWLGARDLWNPNEPLYGSAVAGMAERGDWLVPVVNGQVFDEKPILYFWLALASARALGGVNELTLRLPSALAGIAVVLGTYLLVVPYAGRRRGVVSAVLVATTFIVYWSARTIQMDLILTATTLGAVLAATRTLDWRFPPLAGWSLAGVAAGIGFLAKGPVGLLAPGLPVLGYLIATRRLGQASPRKLLPGAAAFLLVASPWYILLWWRGHDAFLHEVLYRQNVLRFFEPWDHAEPFWYYLGYFWIDMAPWSLFVPLAVGVVWATDTEKRLHRLAWLWLAVLVVFFSLSASKRSPYILPVAPAVAVLAAGVVDRLLAGTLERGRARAAALICGVAALALAGAGVVTMVRGEQLARGIDGLRRALPFVGGTLLAGGVLVLVLLAARRRLAPAALAIAVAAVYLVANRATAAVDPLKSHRAFATAIVRHVGVDDPLRGYRLWKWRASYSYYSGRSVPSLESLGELRAYWEGEREAFLVVERGRLDEARTVIGDSEPLAGGTVGSNAAWLFSNRRAVPISPSRATPEGP